MDVAGRKGCLRVTGERAGPTPAAQDNRTSSYPSQARSGIMVWIRAALRAP